MVYGMVEDERSEHRRTGVLNMRRPAALQESWDHEGAVGVSREQVASGPVLRVVVCRSCVTG